MIAGLVIVLWMAPPPTGLRDALRVLRDSGCAPAEPLLKDVAQNSANREHRMKALLEQARCASDAIPPELYVAEKLYRDVFAERTTALEGEEELTALTAVNELAALFIRSGRAQEASALYDLPPPRDPKTRLSIEYSSAVTYAAAGYNESALEKIVDVLQNDAMFASAADLAIALLASVPAETAVVRLPRVVKLLDKSGLHEHASRAINAVLNRTDACNDRLQAVAGAAFVRHAAATGLTNAAFERDWRPRLIARRCDGLLEVVEVVEQLLGDDSGQMKAAANRLIASTSVQPAEVVQILSNAAAGDVAAERFRAALAKLLVAADVDPASDHVLSNAAYFASLDPQPGDVDKIRERLTRTGAVLSATSRAHIYVQLGHLLDASHRIGESVQAWRTAEKLFGDKAVPELKLSLARAELKLGDAEAARTHVVAAAHDCQSLGRDTCIVSALREGVTLGVVPAETAIQFGIDPGLVRPPKPISPVGKTPPGQVDIGGPFMPGVLFDVPLREFTATGSYRSTFPVHGNAPPGSAPRPSTPVESNDVLAFLVNGPLIPDYLWVRAAYDYDRNDRQIAGIPQDATNNWRRGGMSLQAAHNVLVSATVNSRGVNEIGRGAAPSRSIDATSHVNSSVRGAELQSTIIFATQTAEMRLGTSESIYADAPTAPTSQIAILDHAGIRRGSSNLENNDTRVHTLVVRSDRRLTASLRAEAGVHISRSGANAFLAASPANAFLIEAANHPDAVPFDVLRVYRTAPISRSSDSNIGWLSLQFDDLTTNGYVGVRYRADRGHSTSGGAPANSLEPLVVPALQPTSSIAVRWEDVAPAARITTRIRDRMPHSMTVSLSYNRYIEPLEANVIDFTNAARLASADFAVDNNQEAGSRRFLAAYGLSGTRRDVNVVGELRPPLRDELGLRLTQEFFGGNLDVEIGGSRTSRILGTRPIVREPGGAERPSSRSDYVPLNIDHGGATAGSVFTLNPDLTYTGGYLLENEDRRRQQRFIRAEWWHSSARSHFDMNVHFSQHEWRIGEEYRDEHDPTPIAAGYNRFGFYAGNVDRMPADELSGIDFRSRTIPNSRWTVNVNGYYTFTLPRIGDVFIGGDLSAAEGWLQDPFVVIYPTDDVQRNVATTAGGVRLPNMTSLGIFLRKNLTIGTSNLTLSVECRRCNGSLTPIRQIVQLNDGRAGAEEETLSPRTFMLSARVVIH
jgi:hypothetical protein